MAGEPRRAVAPAVFVVRLAGPEALESSLVARPDGTDARPFPSLRAALAAAPDGALLRLGEGEFRERIEITRPVALVGQGAGRTRLISPDGKGPVIRVHHTDRVRIEGLSVEGGATGIVFEGGLGHRLEALSLSGMREAAVVAHETQLIFSASEVTNVSGGVRGYGLDVAGGSLELRKVVFRAAGRRAIQIRNASATVEDVEVERSGLSALQVLDGAQVRVRGGRFTGMGGAAIYAGGARLSIDGARIGGSEFGVIAYRGSELTVIGAEIGGYRVAGVALVNARGAVERCAIAGAGSEAAISITGRAGDVPVLLVDNRIRDPGPLGVHITNASVVARGNSITGARLDRERDMGDAFYAVESDLRFEDNVLRGNAGSGIVAVRSRVKLENNGLIENGRSGVLLVDASRATAAGNFFERNAAAAVEVAEGAHAALERNRFGQRGSFDIDLGCGQKAGYADLRTGNTFAAKRRGRACP